MRGVDHDPLGLAAPARQRGEYLVEHAQSAPADEAVVDRLVRAVVPRRVAPAQAVLDDEHYRTDDPPVVHPSHPMRQRKISFDPAHLRLGQQKQISHGDASPPSQGISRFNPMQVL
jgi:hypothetical protein